MKAEGERKAHINIKWKMEYEVLDSYVIYGNFHFDKA